MKNIYLLICVLCTMALKSQTLFWGETFGVGTTCATNQGTLANGFNSLNGVWTINTFTTGVITNDAFANVWYVSQTEGGRTVGSCGAGCIDSAQIKDRTLHIGAAQNSPTFGSFCPSGDCGAIYDPGLGTNLVRTNTSVQSPTVSCIGKVGITFQFDYILRGNVGDSLNAWAFDGANWINLGPPLPTATCVTIPLDTEGVWATTSYLLPSTFNNNGAVRIGFQWINNDDKKGGSPSVAIDNIQLLASSIGSSTLTPDTVAVFSPDTSNHNFIYCTNTVYHFTGFASQGNVLGYQWEVYPSTNVVLNPAHPSLGQNGIDMTFNTPGTYSIVVIASTQFNGIDSSNSVNNAALAFNTYTITVNPTPTVTVAPPNPIVCLGWTGTNLYATGASTYTWTQAPSVLPPTLLNPPLGDSVNVNPTGIPSPYVTYSVTGTSAAGCNSRPVAVTVTVQPKPTPIYPPNDTICAGSSTLLSVTGMPVNTTYHWGAAFNAGLGTNVGATVYQTPIYHGLVDTLFLDTIVVHVPGCPPYTPSHIVKILVKPTPTAHVLSDTVDNCNKMGATLSVTSTPSVGTTYAWSPHTALSDTVGTPVIAKPTVPTKYYVTPTLDGCVGNADSVLVRIGDTVNVAISTEYDIICSGQKDQLIAYFPNNTNINPVYQYSWTPAPFSSISVTGDTVVAQPTILPPATGVIYTVFVRGICVKHNTATASIVVNTCTPPKTNFTESTDTICTGHCITFKDLTQNNSTKPLFYSWVFAGASAGNGHIYNPPGSVLHGDTVVYDMTNNKPLPSFKVCYYVNSGLNNYGTYPVIETVTNGIGQTSTKTDSVTVFPGPRANAGIDQTIEQGNSTNLDASASSGQGHIIDYNWVQQTDSTYMSCNSGPCIKPVITPSTTTQYILTVTDVNGCSSVDSVIINVDIICKDVYIATAFSPNGDGMNDVLHVKSNCVISQFSFKIFDRWGEKVFESTDPAYGWDGTFRNKIMDTDVFMYTVDGFLSSGTEVKKKGNVTLMR